MNVLVTGGAGFIGGHLAVHLRGRGFDVVVVDSLERASMARCVENAEARLIVGDLRSGVDLPKVDVVVHAAYIDVAESFEKPYDYMVNNVAVTGRVAKKAFDDGSHLVYVSSAAVYGDPVYLPIDEGHPRVPLSPYGLSKFLVNRLLSSTVGWG